MIKKVIKDIPNCIADVNLGMTADYAKKVGANLIIKGYRNADDLAYEEDQARKNKEYNPDAETIILKSSNECSLISSSLIKELVTKDEDVSKYLPKEILKFVTKKLRKVK